MEQQIKSTKPTRPSKKRMALTFCIGLAFIALVCWLLVGSVMGIVGLFRATDVYTEGVDTESIAAAAALHDQLQQVEADSEEYFQILLSNFVMQDVPPFSNPDDINSEYIVSYGLWQAITLNNSQGILQPYDEAHGLAYRVPKKLVEKLALYYIDYTDDIKHTSVDLCGTFKYNGMNGTYAVPSSYPVSYLIPKVVSVELNADDHTATVTVDCYEYNDVDEDPTAKEQNFRKREVFVLKKAGNTVAEEATIEETRYQIVSMKQIDKISQEDKE